MSYEITLNKRGGTVEASQIQTTSLLTVPEVFVFLIQTSDLILPLRKQQMQIFFTGNKVDQNN
jgi:hypothetical protein